MLSLFVLQAGLEFMIILPLPPNPSAGITCVCTTPGRANFLSVIDYSFPSVIYLILFIAHIFAIHRFYIFMQSKSSFGQEWWPAPLSLSIREAEAGWTQPGVHSLGYRETLS
jgi:hypothetical protein